MVRMPTHTLVKRSRFNCSFYLSIDLPNPPIEALLSACALGVLHNDDQLSELVLVELKKFERDYLWCHHIAFLTSELYLKKVSRYRTPVISMTQVRIVIFFCFVVDHYYYLCFQQNQPAKALQYLYSQIHSYPDKPLLRKVLANFLLHNCKKDEKHLTAANRMVEGTIVMQRIDSKR